MVGIGIIIKENITTNDNHFFIFNFLSSLNIFVKSQMGGVYKKRPLKRGLFVENGYQRTSAKTAF